MSTVVRFAPSPTGYIHAGNIRTALFNYLYACQSGADTQFILRLDDTDAERSKDEYTTALLDDLKWLGISWDRFERQSERLERYGEVFEKLKENKRVYPCYETADELEYKRRRQRARGLPPIYDRAGMHLTDEQKKKYEDEGRKPHWRFVLEHEDVVWDDMSRGECRYHGGHLSDPVVVREDGTLLYMLPSTVDDSDFGVTHVIRGEDHVTNTAVQIQMFKAVGATPPTFAHVPLITGLDGKLSKRLGAISVRELRQMGLEPMAVNNFLAGLGTSEGPVMAKDLQELSKTFSLDSFGRSQPRFDPEDLVAFNARLVRELEFDAVKSRLSQFGLTDDDAAFWNTVRPNLSKLADVAEWAKICRGKVEPVIENAEMLKQAAELLPPEPWDETTWKSWTTLVKKETGAKGKGLFHPLRLALTGCESGPELGRLLPLLGRKKAVERLNGKTA